MKHMLKNQTRQAGIALAAVAIATFGTGTALADPATGFTKAAINIATRDSEAQEIAAGDLICSFRETGLIPFGLYSYECRADAAAVVEGCFFKTKLVPTGADGEPLIETTVGLDVTNVEAGHDAELFLANNSGAINSEIVTAIPEAPHTPGGGHLCPEPLEQGVIAARWCGASLTNMTNGNVGATVNELYEEFVRGTTVTVPSCEEMLAQ